MTAKDEIRIGQGGEMVDKIAGYRILAESLRRAGVEVLFYLEGGPMLEAVHCAAELGIRCVDVRHEQAATMMAHGWARVTGKAGVSITSSGPGTCNAVTGVANAQIDRIPVIAIGGSVEVTTLGRGEFQDIDQLEMMRPVAKDAVRIYATQRIPEQIQTAFLSALSGQPGPVYVDLPADVLFREVLADSLAWPRFDLSLSRNPADPTRVKTAVELLQKARRPIVLSGTGAFFSKCGDAMNTFLETTGLCLFTTPQGRGIIPETGPGIALTARSRAFREADLILVVGTRLNFVFNFGLAPRFAEDVTFIHIDVDPGALAQQPFVSVRLQGDAGEVLKQLTEALGDPSSLPNLDRGWLAGLTEEHQRKQTKTKDYQLSLSQTPIDPRRLCAEVAEILPEDAVLAVDGHVILNHARQTIPTSRPGHRLNSGPFGCLGTGVPFGVAAKVASPDQVVMVLTGDGSFGFNAFELDTAVRHNIPIVVVISNNGGWAADHGGNQTGRCLGFTRYDLMFKPLGIHTEYVTNTEEIRPALKRALSSGTVAVVNVVTDPKVDVHTFPFSSYYDGTGQPINRGEG